MKFLKNNFLVKFVVTLFFIGVLIGGIFYLAYKPDLSSQIAQFKELVTTTHQNTFLSSIVIISAIFVLSVSVIGLPIIVFYIFYEGLSIGYTAMTFVSLYKLKGLLFYSLYFIVTKLLFILIMVYFMILSLRYVSRFLDNFFSKNREELYKTVVYHFYRFTIVLGLTILNCLILYFVANKIVGLFINLI